MAGSRSLSSEVGALINSLTGQPIFAMLIEWGGAVGDLWYSDAARSEGGHTMAAKVMDWGQFTSGLDEPGQGNISLDDSDGTVRDAIDAVGLGGKVATLYLLSPGMDEADWAVAWRGITEERGQWREQDATIQLSLTSYEQKANQALTYAVDEDDLPYAAPEAMGQALPVVYGHKRGIRGVCVKGGGPTARLTTCLDFDKLWFYVDDATPFPDSSEGSPIQVYVGREKVEGYFLPGKNRFIITARNLVEHSGQLTFAEAGNYRKLALDTTEEDANYWTGFCIRFRIYDDDGEGNLTDKTGPYQYRTITDYRYEGGQAYAIIGLPFSDGRVTDLYPNGRLWAVSETAMYMGASGWLPVDYVQALDYDICTHRAYHQVGSMVRYAGDGEVVYVVSDAPAQAVNRVYVAIDEEKGSYELIPPGCYTVNLDDNQFGAFLDRNVTTLTFRTMPSAISWSRLVYQSPADTFLGQTVTQTLSGRDAIIADVDGPPTGGSVPYENPAIILRDLAVRQGLTSPDEIDEGSLIAAFAARAAYRCGFAYQAADARSCDILRALARQAGLALDWTTGTLRAVALRNDIDVANLAKTIASDDRFMDGWQVEKLGSHLAYDRVTGGFLDYRGRAQQVKQSDADAITAHGLSVLNMDFWSYQNKAPARAIARWWLYRLRYEPDAVTLRGTLRLFDLLPGDIVSYDGRRGWVDQITIVPGEGVSARLLVPTQQWYDPTWVDLDPTYTDPAALTTPEMIPTPDQSYVWVPEPNHGGVARTTSPSPTLSVSAEPLPSASVSPPASPSAPQGECPPCTGSLCWLPGLGTIVTDCQPRQGGGDPCYGQCTYTETAIYNCFYTWYNGSWHIDARPDFVIYYLTTDTCGDTSQSASDSASPSPSPSVSPSASVSESWSPSGSPSGTLRDCCGDCYGAVSGLGVLTFTCDARTGDETCRAHVEDLCYYIETAKQTPTSAYGFGTACNDQGSGSYVIYDFNNSDCLRV